MNNPLPHECEAYVPLLSLLAAGEQVERDVPPGATLAVGQHLATCHECQQRLAQLSEVVATLQPDSLPWLDESAAAVVRRLSADLAKDSARRRHPRPIGGQRNWQRTALWTAGTLVAAAVGWLLLSGWFAGGGSPSRVARSPEQPVPSNPRHSREEDLAARSPLRPTGYATLWELERSMAVSDEALEQTLSRGGAAANRQTRGFTHLYKELLQ